MSELKRVMYVEDDRDIQTIVRIALETVGKLELLICNSGAEALEKVEAFRPDFILLDVMMPGLDGPQTLEALRQMPAFSNTPVAFVTAKVQPQEIERLLELGAVDVIAKPFDAMTLASKVRALHGQATA